MIAKKDLVKIHDYLWEIPKKFRPDMRVPARIYADEKMLEKIFEDKTLEQLVNSTTFPGITKYALAMPDAHEGYGVCIGFVGGMDLESGVISPGSVGYDISCLSGESKILHTLGYQLPIKRFEDKAKEVIQCINFRKKVIEEAPLQYFLRRHSNPCIFRVLTKTGQAVRATSEHPFYTPQGMIPLGYLNKGDKIALYPFKGVSYQEPKEKILVDEKKIKKYWTFLNQNPAGHGLEQIINQLKKRNLLPFKTTSSQFPYLLKIMGYLLGDGTMSFGNKKRNGQIIFYGKKKDLYLLKEDIEKIGFKANIYQRLRKYKIKTFYKTYQFQRNEISLAIRGSSFVLLLWALGMPLGNKAKQNFLLPRWIFTLPLWQKRLFLAGLFGAELSSPKSITKHGFNFNCPVLGINKNEQYISSGKKVLIQIAKLLEAFDVKTRKIITRPDYKNNKREISYRHRLFLASEPENLINLWSNIGYEYQQEKQFLANLAVFFIKSKQKFIEEKILSQGIKARKGLIRFKKSQLKILHDLIKRGGSKLARPFVGQFPIFKEFIKEVTKGFGQSGMVWDEIVEIKKIPYNGWVYDFTVAHPDHNFIANNFVVSNCGVRVLRSEVRHEEVKPHLVNLMNQIQRDVPSGVGRGGGVKLSPEAMRNVLEKGVKWVVEKGYGEKEDIEHCEEKGSMAGADASAVSERAKVRGRDQLGTLGSGNHFTEIQKVEEIFDEKIAQVFGLFKDQITLMIHSGSRGLGHQVCTDYVSIMHRALDKYKIRLPDPELACAPFNSPEGQRYFGAMAGSANFAWANRQMIMYLVRKVWQKILGERAGQLRLIYDVAHNIAKIEEHNGQKLCVHRKGATRAFAVGHKEVPESYQEIGQPVLIPGTMGTASYILVGTEKAAETFFSVCHGSGRVMSRHAAIRQIHGGDLRRQLEEQGVVVRCLSSRGLAEEAPLAYKDIHNVVDVVVKAGLAKLVARLKPLGVLKG